MKIAIVGFDTEGRATYDHFAAQDHEITICDQNADIQVPGDAIAQLGETYLDGLDRFDLIIRTPGLHPQKILDKNPGVAGKISTQINEFFKVCPTANIIGVTGTKGKGTTSTLITKMLESQGQHVRLGGNIGVPPLTFLGELTAESWVVLELSSFQLIDLKQSPSIAVCLMVVPEHLNWHANMEEYVTAKEQLFVHQQVDDVAVYFADNELSYRIASAGFGQEIPYFAAPGAHLQDAAIVIDGETICEVTDLKLLGEHNWQNVCAAVTAVWQTGLQDAEAIRSVLTTFAGLPHRIELVRELDGVKYYNDSYATGLHATIAAILAVHVKKVMILGGFDRMLDIDHFGTFAVEHADEFRTLLLIGNAAQRLAGILDKAGFTNYVIDQDAQTMPDIVAKARTLAQPGDAVILSPGFASFDLFKNFEDRGNKFREAVTSL